MGTACFPEVRLPQDQALAGPIGLHAEEQQQYCDDGAGDRHLLTHDGTAICQHIGVQQTDQEGRQGQCKYRRSGFSPQQEKQGGGEGGKYTQRPHNHHPCGQLLVVGNLFGRRPGAGHVGRPLDPAQDEVEHADGLKSTAITPTTHRCQAAFVGEVCAVFPRPGAGPDSPESPSVTPGRPLHMGRPPGTWPLCRLSAPTLQLDRLPKACPARETRAGQWPSGARQARLLAGVRHTARLHNDSNNPQACCIWSASHL